MEEQPKIELQKHVRARVSKKYLLKIAFYVVLLVVLGIVIAKNMNNTPKTKKAPAVEKNVDDVNEVDNFTIETE